MVSAVRRAGIREFIPGGASCSVLRADHDTQSHWAWDTELPEDAGAFHEFAVVDDVDCGRGSDWRYGMIQVR